MMESNHIFDVIHNTKFTGGFQGFHMVWTINAAEGRRHYQRSRDFTTALQTELGLLEVKWYLIAQDDEAGDKGFWLRVAESPRYNVPVLFQMILYKENHGQLLNVRNILLIPHERRHMNGDKCPGRFFATTTGKFTVHCFLDIPRGLLHAVIVRNPPNAMISLSSKAQNDQRQGMLQIAGKLTGTEGGEDNFYDVILRLTSTNRDFYCHRVILSNASSVFATMFNSAFVEGSQVERERRIVSISDVSEHAASAALSFIYSSQFPSSNDPEELRDILDVARKYAISPLEEYCVSKLIYSTPDSPDPTTLFRVAERYDLQNLLAVCVRFWSRNVHEVRVKELEDGTLSTLLKAAGKEKTATIIMGITT